MSSERLPAPYYPLSAPPLVCPLCVLFLELGKLFLCFIGDFALCVHFGRHRTAQLGTKWPHLCRASSRCLGSGPRSQALLLFLPLPCPVFFDRVFTHAGCRPSRGRGLRFVRICCLACTSTPHPLQLGLNMKFFFPLQRLRLRQCLCVTCIEKRPSSKRECDTKKRAGCSECNLRSQQDPQAQQRPHWSEALSQCRWRPQRQGHACR